MSGPLANPDDVATIALRYLGKPNHRLSNAREWRYGSRGSLAVVLERGVFFDHESGASGGMLDLIIHAGVARDRAEAARMLELGDQVTPRETARERNHRKVAYAKALAARIGCATALWGAGKPIAGTIGEIYLRDARAIGAPLEAAALRFLPGAPLTPYAPDHRRYPAIIAAVADAARKFNGAHLTFLQPDGSGKADLSAPSKMIGKIGGGHVPIIPGSRMVVAEGIESALSAWEVARSQARAASGGLGAVAALSAGGLAALIWPAGTAGLVIAPDNDPNGAGDRAAQVLARRARSDGLSVAFLVPPEGISDWNEHRVREAQR